MTISVKISEENYKWICDLSGDLRKKLHKPVSINDTLTYIKEKKEMKLSDLAGTLKITDKEAEGFLINLKKGWKKWIIKSA